MGRPRGTVTTERTDDLVRHLAATGSLAEAAILARVDGLRVLRLLDADSVFRQAAFALTETEARAA